MRQRLLLQLLSRTLEYDYSYHMGTQFGLVEGRWRHRAAILGRHPSMPEGKHIIVAGCVHHCFCRQPKDKDQHYVPNNWREELRITEELSCAFYFASFELEGHDPQLRKEILRALLMFEWPEELRPQVVSPEAKTFQGTEDGRPRVFHGQYIPKYHGK